MNNKPFSTPILFLIFNRPDTTAKVFQRIRELKPRYLFISADGPRAHRIHEKELCETARTVVANVDWDCEVRTNYREENAGCKIGVSSGITWFFENVEEGIILEDDCLPEISFFHFCEALLEYYRNDERIMHIGGANFQDGIARGNGSYYFSNINHIWGWATWKRAWGKYDVAVSSYPELLKENILPHLFANSKIERFWKKKFELAYNNKIDTWDIQWQYAMSINHGLAIIPNKNLVANIGFHDAATHTIDKFNTLGNIPTSAIDIIIHPSQMIPDAPADFFAFKKYFSPPKAKKLLHLMLRNINTLKIFF
jgi:hypothetical protein